MYIETDLNKIKERAATKEEENIQFRTFLKQLKIEIKELDSIVHKINDEVSTHIDCTECANCCKHIRPILSGQDINRLANGMQLAVANLKKQYIMNIPLNPEESTFNAIPCPFLKDNLCTHYEYRPKACQSYPHLNKNEFVFRLWGVVENYAICPIVYNVYERLKEELWDSDNYI
jgi:Fe-S-cluster containining protein